MVANMQTVQPPAYEFPENNTEKPEEVCNAHQRRDFLVLSHNTIYSWLLSAN